MANVADPLIDANMIEDTESIRRNGETSSVGIVDGTFLIDSGENAAFVKK